MAEPRTGQELRAWIEETFGIPVENGEAIPTMYGVLKELDRRIKKLSKDYYELYWLNEE